MHIIISMCHKLIIIGKVNFSIQNMLLIDVFIMIRMVYLFSTAAIHIIEGQAL